MKSDSTQYKRIPGQQVLQQQEAVCQGIRASIDGRNIFMLFALAVVFLATSLSAKVQAEGLPDFEKLISEQG